MYTLKIQVNTNIFNHQYSKIIYYMYTQYLIYMQFINLFHISYTNNSILMDIISIITNSISINSQNNIFFLHKITQYHILIILYYYYLYIPPHSIITNTFIFLLQDTPLTLIHNTIHIASILIRNYYFVIFVYMLPFSHRISYSYIYIYPSHLFLIYHNTLLTSLNISLLLFHVSLHSNIPHLFQDTQIILLSHILLNISTPKITQKNSIILHLIK